MTPTQRLRELERQTQDELLRAETEQDAARLRARMTLLAAAIEED